jgi:hypothetical protein
MQTFHPNGSLNDDTAAFQAAVLAAANDELEIASGDLRLTGPITIPAEMALIFRKGARLLVDHPSCDVLSVEGQWVRMIEPRIEAMQPRTGGAYVRLKQGLANRFKSEGGRFSGYHIGVAIEQVATASIGDLNCLNGAAGNGVAVDVSGGFDLTISDLLCDAAANAQPSAGVRVSACGDLLLTRSNIIHHGQNLLVCPGFDQVVASLWVTDTFLDTANRGALFIPSNGGRVVRGKFSDVWASGHADQGILLLPQSGGAIDGIDISGLHCFLNGSSGVHLEAGSKNVRMLGGAVAQNVQSGIVIGANVERFSVQGVTSGPADGLSGNGGYGMLVYGNGHSHYRITDNELSGNASGSLYDPLPCATKIVKDNLQ